MDSFADSAIMDLSPGNDVQDSQTFSEGGANKVMMPICAVHHPQPFNGAGGHSRNETHGPAATGSSILPGVGDHKKCDIHSGHVADATLLERDDQPDADTQMPRVVTLTPFNGKDHTNIDNHARRVDPIISNLIELHRQRQDLHRAEKSLTLQINAKCRRMVDGDKKEADVLYAAMFGKKEHDLAMDALVVSQPFIEARALLESQRKTTEKQMEKLAKQLPASEFVQATKGFSWGSLAALIGECGNLSNYSNPAKVWKRMGLAVIEGDRQRRVTGDEALKHGYSPIRRSIVWNIGDCLIKANSPGYREIYDERKAIELPRVATEGKENKGHAHNRAKRYMEKRLLLNLWRAWRDNVG